MIEDSSSSRVACSRAHVLFRHAWSLEASRPWQLARCPKQRRFQARRFHLRLGASLPCERVGLRSCVRSCVVRCEPPTSRAAGPKMQPPQPVQPRVVPSVPRPSWTTSMIWAPTVEGANPLGHPTSRTPHATTASSVPIQPVLGRTCRLRPARRSQHARRRLPY